MTAATTPAVRAVGLVKVFGTIRAVDDVTFELAPGGSTACSDRTAPARRRSSAC